MKAVSRLGRMQSAQRRFRRQRLGGAPGECGPWFSWDSLHPDEYQKPGNAAEEDPRWDEFDVHLLLSWDRLLAENPLGTPVLPEEEASNSVSLADFLPPRTAEAGASPQLAGVDPEAALAFLVQYVKAFFHANSRDSLALLRQDFSRVLATEEGRVFSRLVEYCRRQQMYSYPCGTLISLLHLRPIWVRSLTTWTPPEPDQQHWLNSLIDHLLVKFPVPDFLRRDLWHPPGSLEYVDTTSDFLVGKQAIWFVLTGLGISLHHASAYFGWVVPKRMVHWFGQVPPECSLSEATLWIEVRRAGGSQIEFERLRACYPFQEDFTDSDRARRELLGPLRETIQWLIKHREELTHETSTAIMEWLAHEITENQVGRSGRSLKGRGVPGALALAQEYIAQRNQPYRDTSWSAHGWNWETTDSEGKQWSVLELTSGAELYEEGNAMRHCVAGYSNSCKEGKTAIFSLSTSGRKQLTIEVSLPNRRVVQARGVCNRPATEKEMKIVGQWCAEILECLVPYP